MKYEIKNRFNGSVIYTADIDADGSTLESVKIGLAVEKANLRGANLREANLSEADLSGANLRGANLSEADLREANLREANLLGANLSEANLSEANLRGANLRGANLSEADLLGANLLGANLRGANLREANLSGANLSGANHILDLGQRSDGYQFYAQIKGGIIWILAGCRYMPIKDADNHWRNTRDGTMLGNESQQFLKQARALVEIRNLGKAK